jgi:hypothetical protein
MTMMLAVLDTHALLKVIYSSIAIVVAISFAYATLLYAAVRAVDNRRQGNSVASLAYGAIAALGAAVILGFYLIIAS